MASSAKRPVNHPHDTSPTTGTKRLGIRRRVLLLLALLAAAVLVGAIAGAAMGLWSQGAALGVPTTAVEYLQPTMTEQLTLQTSTALDESAPQFVVLALPEP